MHTELAETYDVPVASVKAIVEVEASGDGFLADGRPKILFEAHHFGKRTGYKFNKSNPGVSVSTWDEAKRLYKGGEKEYRRLDEARALNEPAALESASWGAGQVMGFNWKPLGYASVYDFVEHMKTAAGQMDAMMRYCQVNNLLDEMRRFPDMDACRAFAAGYNGSGAVDVYAPKIQDAFLRHDGHQSAWPVLRRGDRGDAVQALQRSLGIDPDGDFGPKTEAAVRLYQADQGLTIDGIVGKQTRIALGLV